MRGSASKTLHQMVVVHTIINLLTNESICTDMNDVESKIVEKMESRLSEDSSGHEVSHHVRVYRVAKRIAEEEDADVGVVCAAALTHDLHRSIGDKDTYTDPKESLDSIEEILQEVGFEEGKIQKVLYCVLVHEDYSFEGENEVESLEAQVLQDADNLDAIGFVGVARTFRFGGSRGLPMWETGEELSQEYNKKEIKDSTVKHIHEKLLRLKDAMNTTSGRKIAKKRHKTVRRFVNGFKKEWNSEDVDEILD